MRPPVVDKKTLRPSSSSPSTDTNESNPRKKEGIDQLLCTLRKDGGVALIRRNTLAWRKASKGAEPIPLITTDNSFIVNEANSGSLDDDNNKETTTTNKEGETNVIRKSTDAYMFVYNHNYDKETPSSGNHNVK